MEPRETETRREPAPLAVVFALALLALVAMILFDPTVEYWSAAARPLESASGPVHPLLGAILYTLYAAATALAWFGVLKHRFWGRVTGIAVGGVGILGTIPLLAEVAAPTGIAVLGLFAAVIGLLCSAGAAAWCRRRDRGART
ncbi:hypothetical protein K3N28_20590 [Glycomyces sp. TRM65418]|uniref:hypothetical protein n=1 Tax=Glycomyces sp. TRM65418 TaxID=2867006 RepID=UPI001CE6B11B|nr:hypothetical protein [Glycomyces sp. TRM65418]MCC3765463.1 hypothetical protein [Glycomyces sp. TRM65418]QZD55072.1 hypothetical protein K3N28_20490 [Glycomyces sp. TRM65418]